MNIYYTLIILLNLMISYYRYILVVYEQVFDYRQNGNIPKLYSVSVLVPYLGITLF